MEDCPSCKKTISADDSVTCFVCSNSFHGVECCGLTRTTFKVIRDYECVKYCCNNCNSSSLAATITTNFKHLSDTLSSSSSTSSSSNYDNLIKKIDFLSTEVSNVKKLVNMDNNGTPIRNQSEKRLLNGSKRIKLTPQRQVLSDVIHGASEIESSAPIKVIEETEWFHVSRFDPEQDDEEMKKWLTKILDTPEVQVAKLIPKNRSKEELSFVSYKIGVLKSKRTTVLNPQIWPRNVTVKPFVSRPFFSNNYRVPHVHVE